MNLDELERHLLPFCRAHFDETVIGVENVRNMPGHAGFSYGFDV